MIRVAEMQTKLPQTLSEAETKGVVRLLGDLSGMNVGLSQKREILLTQLCRLIKGDGWTWSLTQSSEIGLTCLGLISGGDSSALPKRNLPPRQKKGPNEREEEFKLREVKSPSRSRKISSRSLEAGRRPGVLSFSQLSGDTLSFIVFGRKPGRKPFLPQEEELARMVVEEVSWLHGSVTAAKTAPTENMLSQRQKDTLNLWRLGLSYKDIAIRLQISNHTVHGYIKDIYRHFEIRSQAELIKLLMLRGQ